MKTNLGRSIWGDSPAAVEMRGLQGVPACPGLRGVLWKVPDFQSIPAPYPPVGNLF